ncbi:MAG TPA: bifunctional [glutamine synthetase] adenylyltransferase/[glutamine synthetase]-adenylyl-L-tyrosine phosphorylase [Rhizomicrobium sp.]
MTEPKPIPREIPAPFDHARADRVVEALAEGGFVPSAAQAEVFAGAFGNSPYLARLAVRERDFLQRTQGQAPAAVLEEIESRVRSIETETDIAMAMQILRVAKRQAALTIALADIGDLWNLTDVTHALSRFADVCISASLRLLLREAATHGDIDATDPAALEADTGLVVLAMGKYGAFELNYSSDIDLVTFYEPRRFPFRKRDDARGAAVDIVKALVKLLSETTADGYVFRVDLRLRPDAGATQVAISTDAAEAYYEGMGQNWERAAMIKARACAGDLIAGTEFLDTIKPFVWRRSLDYAAIEDIHSIKRQIHAHGKHGAIAVAGHNVKLGRGGIREIEFFAQTQQLILGGRNPQLRSRETLKAIEALRAAGLVTDETAADLGLAYDFLRKLEHRLQMIEDEQTHTLPKSESELAHVACFMGFADTASFSEVLLYHLRTVQKHYLKLFEQEAPLATSEGSLVFTGVEDDPETIETLSKMGFHDPHHVAHAIRGWHHGRIRATRSARAREILTKLMPALLDALAATADPDAAFTQFDRFVSRLPGGVQLFSLLLANTHLLKLVSNICGSAPRLADHLARSPGVLDALMDRGFLTSLPSREQLDGLLAAQLSADYEAALDGARRFAKEQIFRVGVQIMEHRLRADAAGPAFTNIAETAIAGLLKATEDELAASFGHVPSGTFTVVAMGKLGGREMTASSDLDLIFVYDAADEAMSDGSKPLPASVFYARLAQRLIAALTVPTAEGPLYEVDMRLRPTGNKGPVAVSLESFARYHANESWTWERLALTRARIIAGSESLGDKVTEVIRSTLISAPDRAKILTDAADMRAKLFTQFPGKAPWDLKFARGGLVDIEFIAQTLQLLEAHDKPNVLHSNTVGALNALAQASAVEATDAVTLMAAAELETALMQVLRIAVDGEFETVSATPGLKALLARAGGEGDFAELEAKLRRLQAGVATIFEKRIAPPG